MLSNMNDDFAPGSAVVVIFAAVFSVVLATSNNLEKRLSGTWNVDHKASREYQQTGKVYDSAIMKLWQNTSMCFDRKEKTCLIRTALDDKRIKYQILSKGNGKITLSIGEQSFIFEFMDDDKALLCLSNKDAGCFVLSRGEVSCSQE